MDQNEKTDLQKDGLYGGNVILEFEPDQKVIKHKCKVNEKATQREMDQALANFQYLLQKTYQIIAEQGLPSAPIKETKLNKDIEEIKKTQSSIDKNIEKLAKIKRGDA